MMTFVMTMLLLVFSALPAQAATYYLSLTTNSPAGNDSNSCAASQTITTPKATMNSILACAALTGGDTIYIRGGTYNQRMDFQTAAKNGSAGLPITVAGYPGETVTWKYTDPTHNDYGGIKARTNNYLTFKDFILDGSNYAFTLGATGGTGWTFTANQHDIILDNLEITGQPFHGVLVQAASNITIRNCRIHHPNLGQGDVPNWRWLGIYIHDGSNIVYEHNDVYAMPGGGIQVYPGPIANVTIRYNKIRDSAFYTSTTIGGIVVQGDSGPITGVQIYDNLIYNNGLSTTSAAPVIALKNNVQSAKIWNNLLYGAKSANGAAYGVVIFAGSTAVTGTTIQNNIIYNNATGTLSTSPGSGNVIDHNLTTTPGFTNEGALDFTLASGSAAINAGTNVGLPFNGSAPDIGPFETFGFSNASINQASLDVTLAMNANVPVSGTFTGFTVACSGSGCGTPIVQSAAKLTGSDSVVRLNLTGITTGVCAAGQTWTVSYIPGGVTDSALIGHVSNQSLFAFTNQAVTNGCAAGAPPTPPTVTGISYLFDDGSGTSAADSTGGGSTGTLTGNPLPTWVTGKHGGALSFPDQINSYVAVPYGSGVNPFTQALTICGGVFPLAGTESSQRIAWSTDNGTSQRLYLGHFGATWGIGVQSSGFATNNEFPVSPGWTHLCLKMSAGTATLYVNGVKGLSSQSVKTYTSYTLASNFKIGLETTNTINYGATTQDEWKLFTSALTDQNITDLYLNWEPPPPPPPAGVFAQKNHQFFNATTATAGGTPVSIAAIGASATLVRPNTSFGLVTQTDCTGGACTPLGERLRYSYKPVATGVAGPFLSVPDVCGTDNICFYGSTADPLVLSGTVTCCLSGALTAVDGTTQFTMGATPIVTLAQNSSMVQRRMLIVTNGAASGDIYYFKEYDQNDVSGVGFTAGTPYTPSAGAQLTVQATSFTAPASLRQTGSASNTLVDIIWAPVTDSTFAGYHVYESQTSGVYGSPVATITPAIANATHSSVTQWRTVHTTAGTYYYIVKAFDTSGNESAASAEITVVLTGMNPRVAR